jgi:hypothetical protein
LNGNLDGLFGNLEGDLDGDLFGLLDGDLDGDLRGDLDGLSPTGSQKEIWMDSLTEIWKIFEKVLPWTLRRSFRRAIGSHLD